MKKKYPRINFYLLSKLKFNYLFCLHLTPLLIQIVSNINQ